MLFATTNSDKIREIGEILRLDLEPIRIELPELQTIEVRDVIVAKADAAFLTLGRPCLVEDTGLSILAWNGLPGALIKWFLKGVGPDGICKMMRGWPDRRALAVTSLGIRIGETTHVFDGSIEGRIALEPRGSNGFGWDSLFEPIGFDRTFAEMTGEEKNSVSMRAKAAEAFATFLRSDESAPSW